MEGAHTQTPPELIFPAQVPFSWTRRWARRQRSKTVTTPQRSFRIAGSARSPEALSAAIAFAQEHDARLELD